MWDARRATMLIYYITYILRASGSTYVSEFLIYIIHAHDAHGAISEINSVTFTLSIVIAIDDASLHTLYMYTLRKYRPPRST